MVLDRPDDEIGGVVELYEEGHGEVVLGGELGAHEAWVNVGYVDAARREVHGGAREVEAQRGFASTVFGGGRQGYLACEAGDSDDMPPATLDHPWDDGQECREGTHEVGLEYGAHLGEGLLRHGDERSADPGVGHDQVEASDLSVERAYSLFGLFGAGDVEEDDMGAAPGRFDRSNLGFERGGAPCSEPNLIPAVREATRERSPNPTRCTRDQRL